MKYDKKYINELCEEDDGSLSLNLIETQKFKMNVKQKERRKIRNKEIRNGVNDMDKYFTGKIKKKKKYNDIDDSYIYEERIILVKSLLTRLICVMNGLNPNKYVSYSKIFGTEIERIKINKKFIKRSKWFNTYSRCSEEDKFKVRFITMLFLYLIDNIEALIDISYKVNKNGKFIEYSVKSDYVLNMISNTLSFKSMILTGNDYSRYLLSLEEVMSFCNIYKVKKNLKKVDTIRIQFNALINHLHRLFNSQSISIDTIIKLSYLVATNEYDVRDKFTYHDDYKYYNRELTIEMIEDLGKEINKSYKKKGLSEMFKIFISASPVVKGEAKTNVSNDLLLGTVAIEYLGFLTNNKYVYKAISKIIGE